MNNRNNYKAKFTAINIMNEWPRRHLDQHPVDEDNGWKLAMLIYDSRIKIAELPLADQFEAFQELCNKANIEVIKHVDENQETMLHRMASWGDFPQEWTQWLIETFQLDLHAVDAKGRTPLQYASEHNRPKMIEVLLRYENAEDEIVEEKMEE